MNILLNTPATGKQIVEAFQLAVELLGSWKVMALAKPPGVHKEEEKYGALAYLDKEALNIFPVTSPRIILAPLPATSRIKVREVQILFARGNKESGNPLWGAEDYPKPGLLFRSRYARDFDAIVAELKKMVPVVMNCESR